MGHFMPDLLLKNFWFDPLFKSLHQKKCLPGLIPLLFFHGSPTKCLEGLSLKFGVRQTLCSKVTKTIFLIFSGLWQPPMTSEVMRLLKYQIGESRAFQNGMTLAYPIKIEVSRPSRSFESDLTKFCEKV